MTYTIPPYRPKTKRAMQATWSDGFHLVRPASPKDRHALRWVVTHHKGIPSKLLRHAETEQEAIEIAKRATQVLHKEAKGKVRVKPSKAQSANQRPTEASPSGSQPSAPSTPRVLPKFSTYLFHCIAANPVAQVWQCHSLPGEKGKVGPKTKDGRPNQQATFKHQRRECAVLFWREPVRNPDGSVRVFTRQEAELFALDAYFDTPEDERILWREGNKKVHSTEHVDILFDPAINGEATPFNLLAWWAPGQSKVVKDSALYPTRYAKAGRKVSGGSYLAQTPEQAAALAAAKRLAEIASDESRTLSDKDATFSTIWGAEAYALKHIEPTIPRRRGPLKL